MSSPRRASVPALAKVNLDLRVLWKRPDGYHEVRTIYQTVSLADRIDLEFTPGRRSGVEFGSEIDIPDNLALRAAEAVLRASRAKGRVRIRLIKKIPIGAGLGGGSSDAAAVLLALPVLAGRRLPLEHLLELAAQLGSDVPFFLLGGRAAGLGRGAELYPLPDGKAARGLLVAPDIHVSTAQAYRALGRELTSGSGSLNINIFQSLAWNCGEGRNDFEEVVFGQHPRLRTLKTKLKRLGACPAMLSGSGAALFGIFSSREALLRARSAFTKERVFPIALVTRARYRALWWRSLAAHIDGKLWPPQSRYAQ